MQLWWPLDGDSARIRHERPAVSTDFYRERQIGQWRTNQGPPALGATGREARYPPSNWDEIRKTLFVRSVLLRGGARCSSEPMVDKRTVLYRVAIVTAALVALVGEAAATGRLTW